MWKQADDVAREFLVEHFPKHQQIHVTILRLAILDCWFMGNEDNFIARVTEHKLYRTAAKKVLDIAAPFMVDLAGAAYMRASL